MEYTHITNLVSMLQALLVGVGMGVYYDCFRFWRRMIQCRWPSVALQDLVFWLTSAVAVFFICIRWNGGYIRIYFVFFVMCGWMLYFFTAGKIAFFVLDLILNFTNRIFKIVQNKIIQSFEKINKIRFKSD